MRITKEMRRAEKDARIDFIVRELCRHSQYKERSGLAEKARESLRGLSQTKIDCLWTLVCLGRLEPAKK